MPLKQGGAEPASFGFPGLPGFPGLEQFVGSDLWSDRLRVAVKGLYRGIPARLSVLSVGKTYTRPKSLSRFLLSGRVLSYKQTQSRIDCAFFLEPFQPIEGSAG